MITLPAHRSPLTSSRQERGKAPRLPVLLSLLLLLGLVAGCSSAYYNTMEKLGVHKRDIMVDRVGEARDAQEATKEQFQSALEQFSQVVEVKGGDLEQKYKVLNDQYKQCKAESDNVHKRIAAVEGVSAALFREWEAELDQYTGMQSVKEVLRSFAATALSSMTLRSRPTTNSRPRSFAISTSRSRSRRQAESFTAVSIAIISG